MRTARTTLIGMLAAAAVASQVPAASAATGPPTGTLHVGVTAPEGVPVNVLLDSANGKTHQVAPKAPAGTSVMDALTSLPLGAYKVTLPSVTFHGVRYVGMADKSSVVAMHGGPPSSVSSVDVRYVADQGATDLQTTAITQSSVALSWAAPSGAKVTLRRTTGTIPASSITDGVAVPVSGNQALDLGLQPGAQYSYALFTQNNGVGPWTGPLTALIGTFAPAGSTAAAYVAAPSTLIAKPADIVTAAPTGTGVLLVLQTTVSTPLIGAGVVLPISSSLPGGYLGVVSSVTSDGHTVTLSGGSLSSAFDYYDIDLSNFSTGAVTSSSTLPPANLKKAPLMNAAPQMLLTTSSSAAKCESGGAAVVEFTPSLSLGGHFKSKLTTHPIFGQALPVGASVDMALTATVTGAASVKTSAAYTCKILLPEVFKTLTVTPVPLSVKFSPSAEFGVEGAIDVSNVGFTATGGFTVAGTMTFPNSSSFSGAPILDLSPLTPVAAVKGTMSLKLGGELIIGPGAGTADAGVIAGVSGEMNPLDASVEVSAGTDGFCITWKAEFSRSLSLLATAWLEGWSASAKVVIPALAGSTPYGGSPWHFPKDCDKPIVTSPPDSLLGPGVTKIGDTFVGTPGQAGFVSGFVPNQKTWVLSTGLIANAIGVPSDFASTDLGTAGDDALSALSGHPTYDAASYQVDVKPTGSTLHVRYVFASEEYPDFVGSQYNDVMAVFVNGVNCAMVPGTSTPVSINTINDHTNSAYYVDNSTGAAGYATSMNGLTKPLECAVPVTPGVPVSVRIAVADGSDHIYDSAVALVDGGIWSN